MFIPFEPVIPFTIGSLIIWYMLMILCGALGALGSIFCKSVTYIKMTIGILCGVGYYYSISWIFQSKISIEFGRIFKTVL